MTDTPAAPHTPSDDPRVDILAEALVAEWRLDVSRLSDRRGGPTYKRARDLLARLDAAAPAPESPREERDRLYREHVQACTDPRHKHPALDTPNDTPQFDWQAAEEGFVPCARGQRCELQLVRPGKVQCDCDTPGTDAAIARAEAELAPVARDDDAVDEGEHRCTPPTTGARGDRYTCWCRRRWECQKTDPLKWISTHKTIDEIGLATGSTMRPTPARDDALARWLDGEIAEADRQAKRASTEYARALEARAYALSEVRDRLGATTNTTPEESTDD